MSDVVIVGAGPAGLALGCYLADAEIPCLILDRLPPAFTHVLESPAYRQGLLGLIQGDVGGEAAGAVLAEMRDFIRRVEGSEEHALRGQLRELGAE